MGSYLYLDIESAKQRAKNDNIGKIIPWIYLDIDRAIRVPGRVFVRKERNQDSVVYNSWASGTEEEVKQSLAERGVRHGGLFPATYHNNYTYRYATDFEKSLLVT